MVGVVIGQEQGFAEDGLAVAPGDAGEQVSLGILHERLHGLQVAAELLDAFGPGCGGGRGRSFRPVAFGPFRGDVFFVAAEFEDIPLGQTEVFEEHPGRVREVCGLGAAEFGRKISYDGVEVGVSVASSEEFDEILAQVLVLGVGHGWPPR